MKKQILKYTASLLCLYRGMAIFGVMFFLSFTAFGQKKYDLGICCGKYEKSIFGFSLVNNSDSTAKISVVNIARKSGDIQLKHFTIREDTLFLVLTPDIKILKPGMSRADLQNKIDDETYTQYSINPHAKIELGVKLKKKIFRRLKAVVMYLPGKNVIAYKFEG